MFENTRTSAIWIQLRFVVRSKTICWNTDTFIYIRLFRAHTVTVLPLSQTPPPSGPPRLAAQSWGLHSFQTRLGTVFWRVPTTPDIFTMGTFDPGRKPYYWHERLTFADFPSVWSRPWDCLLCPHAPPPYRLGVLDHRLVVPDLTNPIFTIAFPRADLLQVYYMVTRARTLGWIIVWEDSHTLWIVDTSMLPITYPYYRARRRDIQ